MRKFIVSGLILFAGTASAQSENQAGEKRIETFVRGNCSSLILAGHDITANCSPVLMNVAYPNGNSSFLFKLSDNAMVSFFGRDNPGINGRAMIYLQRVTFRDSTPDSPSSTVSGVCKYGDPFSGRTVVECEADSNDGRFHAVFVTDGSPPTISKQ